jgi:hypothetical protein
MATKTIHQWVETQAKLKVELLEARLMESLQSGPATDFTDRDWKDLRHLARTGERRPELPE